MSTTLVLEPEPASVRRARRWVVEGAKSAVGTRTDTQAWHSTQLGR